MTKYLGSRRREQFQDYYTLIVSKSEDADAAEMALDRDDRESWSNEVREATNPLPVDAFYSREERCQSQERKVEGK